MVVAVGIKAEMEHAVRHHIRQHLDEDPVHYGKLSERLEEILRTFGENWEQQALELARLVEEVQRGRQTDDTGLDPQTQAPFFAILREERGKHQPVAAADAKRRAHWLHDEVCTRLGFVQRQFSGLNSASLGGEHPSPGASTQAQDRAHSRIGHDLEGQRPPMFTAAAT